MNVPSTLLVIEDDPIVREGLATILEREGYQITKAADGQEALDRLQSGEVPDLILLDMMLPVHDGWEFCHRKQKVEDFDRIPVVIMTGLKIACEEWSSSLGAVALLRKPLNVASLLATVRRFCPGPAKA